MKTFVVLIIAAGFVSAQTDTLTEALKYYPLQNGNYWEYADYSYQIIPYEVDSSFHSLEVTGDTVLSNNRSYKILTRKHIPFDGYISKTYERIDSTTVCVYRYTDDPLFTDKEFLVDSLLADSGDYFGGSYTGFTSNQGVFSTLCLDIYEDSVLNYPTEVRELEDESGIPATNLLFAKGLGFINASSCEFSCGSTVLRYASIDSIEYGTQITAVDNESLDKLECYILYQNFPNPFNPSTNIDYVLPHPGYVTIKVYDVLGNEVATLVNEEKPAGYYEVDFDGRSFASGIYFYVLRSGNFIESRKMLLLK
jgi:hypothetical protein